MKKYIYVLSAGLLIGLIQADFMTELPGSKAELGKLLFFDSILSSDKTISCASCHKPEFAFPFGEGLVSH